MPVGICIFITGWFDRAVMGMVMLVPGIVTVACWCSVMVRMDAEIKTLVQGF